MKATRHVLRLPDFTPTSLDSVMFARVRQSIKRRQGDKQVVAYYAREQAIPLAQAPRRVSLIVTYARGQRSLDPDNIWKSLLDALKTCGLLVNDSYKWVKIGDYDVDRNEQRQTLVILEDLPLPKGQRLPRHLLQTENSP